MTSEERKRIEKEIERNSWVLTHASSSDVAYISRRSESKLADVQAVFDEIKSKAKRS
jgi:hypothetical protein